MTGRHRRRSRGGVDAGCAPSRRRWRCRPATDATTPPGAAAATAPDAGRTGSGVAAAVPAPAGGAGDRRGCRRSGAAGPPGAPPAPARDARSGAATTSGRGTGGAAAQRRRRRRAGRWAPVLAAERRWAGGGAARRQRGSPQAFAGAAPAPVSGGAGGALRGHATHLGQGRDRPRRRSARCSRRHLVALDRIAAPRVRLSSARAPLSVGFVERDDLEPARRSRTPAACGAEVEQRAVQRRVDRVLAEPDRRRVQRFAAPRARARSSCAQGTRTRRSSTARDRSRAATRPGRRPRAPCPGVAHGAAAGRHTRVRLGTLK